MTLEPRPTPQSERQALVSQLSADPAQQPGLRASDADRDVVREALNRAFALGRLDRDEHLERLDAVPSSRTMGELATLVDDVVTDRPALDAPQPAPSTPSGASAVAARPGSRSLAHAIRVWVFVTIITNVVWVLTGVGGYYWPIWPMFGTGIPVLSMLVFGSSPTTQRVSRRQERRELRRGR